MDHCLICKEIGNKEKNYFGDYCLNDTKTNSKHKNSLKFTRSHKLKIPNKRNFSIKGFNKLKRKDSGSSKMISNSNSNINKEEEKVKNVILKKI